MDSHTTQTTSEGKRIEMVRYSLTELLADIAREPDATKTRKEMVGQDDIGRAFQTKKKKKKRVSS